MSYRYEPKDEALRVEYNRIKNNPEQLTRFAERLYKNSDYPEMRHIMNCADDPNCENMYEAFFLNQAFRNVEQRKEDRRHITNAFADEIIRVRNMIDDESTRADEIADRDKHGNEYVDMLNEIVFDLNTIASKLNNWRK